MRSCWDTCRAANVPVAISMAGGYAHDVEAIVRIHTATIREAVVASRQGERVGEA